MSHGAEERTLLLNYSDTLERATLLDQKDNDDDNNSMPSRRKQKGNKAKGNLSKRRGVRVNKGRLGLRVAGYQGVQHLTASELVRHIPLSKLKAAAKKVLKRSGAKRVKRKGKKRGRKKKEKQ